MNGFSIRKKSEKIRRSTIKILRLLGMIFQSEKIRRNQKKYDKDSEAFGNGFSIRKIRKNQKKKNQKKYEEESEGFGNGFSIRKKTEEVRGRF